jgi:hypothetical protein
VTIEAREEALRLVLEFFGIQSPTVDALVALAIDALGAERTSMCVECIRRAQLSRRRENLAALAEIVVAVRSLDAQWWTHPHSKLEPGGTRKTMPTPDENLHLERRAWPTPLEEVAYWALDAVADRTWGLAVDFVDLNSMLTSDRVALPKGARAGDRFILDWDPGARIDATVVERPDGTLGSELDLSSMRVVNAENAGWGWAIAADLGPHRLPDETPGGSNDPYARRIDPGVGERLRAWAARAGLADESVRNRWVSVADVVSATVTADLYRRDSRWLQWACVCFALADGDDAQLTRTLEQLPRLEP